MRIWDVSPGYLSRQSLLGEHRELHGLVNILVNGKKGYSRHPETLRWMGCATGLSRRHAALAAEMRLRGYEDRTPIMVADEAARWPGLFITAPSRQFSLLRGKYAGTRAGRIRLPSSMQQLWAQHKYSVLARDPVAYRSIGSRVAGPRRITMDELAAELVGFLRAEPPPGRLTTAVEHMGGYVRRGADLSERRFAEQSAANMLGVIQQLAWRHGEPYLLSSTALSDLAQFVCATPPPSASRSDL